MDPIINAPSAGEKPALVARYTISKHRARDVTSNVSSFRYFLTILRNEGRKKIPATNHNTR
jgi:hypothetical protein